MSQTAFFSSAHSSGSHFSGSHFSRACSSASVLSNADTLHGRFAHQVQARPQSIALSYEDQSLTYTQLDALATAQAHQLIKQNVHVGSLVAIMLPRSVELIVHILAVLKTGACYVPIDPNYPIDRVEWIVQTCQPSCLISLSHLCHSLWPEKTPPQLTDKLYLLDTKTDVNNDHIQQDVMAFTSLQDSLPQGQLLQGQLSQEQSKEPSQKQPQAPAYIIFTSGSTGKPKGVMVGHSQVTSLLDAVIPLLGNDHTDVWTLFHSFAFDFSVWEIWGALTTGARLCIVPQATTWSSEAFLSLLHQEQVTILNQTPSAFYALITADSKNPPQTKPLALRSVIFGGEALNLQKLSAWWQRHPEGKPRLINMYGITETTVHVSWQELSQELMTGELSPIGNALAGLEVHLLDAQLQPVQQGEVGEIYVSGNQLAFGYLGRPDLTASRFIASPFHHGQRLYRSGDLAMLQGSQLYYQGRADRQLKIRGFRIEPAEIESVIESHPAIQTCAVLAQPEEVGTPAKGLLAFVIPNKNSQSAINAKIEAKIDAKTLRRHAVDQLPVHFIPSEFCFIDALPLTVNGKLDQAALLKIWRQQSLSQNNSKQASAPAQRDVDQSSHAQRMTLLRTKIASTKDTVKQQTKQQHNKEKEV